LESPIPGWKTRTKTHFDDDGERLTSG
jgi:hypothetical protein